MKDKKKNFLEEFKDAFTEELNKKDKEIKKAKEELSEGVITGIVETLANPVKWLRSFFK